MRTQKFTTRGNQKIWFASDFHLSHKQPFIWQARGFASVESHAKAIIDDLNSVVGENDILFYLGDFSLNSTPDETREFFRSIKCRNIYYIWGNHEANVQVIFQESIRVAFTGKVPLIPDQVYPWKWENVTFLGNYARIAINNQPIVLSHFAFFIWDMMQHGAWNICGHSHGNCPNILPSNTEGKILDVGVDVAYKAFGRPCISFEEVINIMQDKNLKVVDHHNQDTT